MAISNIRADFHAELQKVWNIVTSLEDTAWRSDLSKVEIIDGKRFVEHTTSGYQTVFTVTAREECKRWEFDMENDNMHGHWTGIFMLKSRTKRKHLRMIDSSVGAFLFYRIIPSLCIFPM